MIASWIEKTFSSFELLLQDIYKILDLMSSSPEAEEMSSSIEFLYELSKVNSTAAFLLWQTQRQRRLATWLNLPDTQIVTSQLFFKMREEKLVVLKNGLGTLLNSDSKLKIIEKPLAFRELEWFEQISISGQNFSYDPIELEDILKDELIFKSAIIAGAKYKSFQLAYDYSTKRIQGGRKIMNWSSVQSQLSELFLSVKADASLMKDMNLENAFTILKDADHFVSQNMQVLGGAGYMEDYIVERLYRECIFLKNWPLPYKEQLMYYFQREVMPS
ncbi:MAG: acyl-CoA dehydrogenase family protein [Bacteriovorax sp.]|jgi:hypothetical protein